MVSGRFWGAFGAGNSRQRRFTGFQYHFLEIGNRRETITIRNYKDLIIGVMSGMFLVGAVLFLTGAVSVNTSNVDQILGSEYPNLSLACSDDGKVVYVGGYNRVYLPKISERIGKLYWQIEAERQGIKSNPRQSMQELLA
jgi:hypothetical protein